MYTQSRRLMAMILFFVLLVNMCFSVSSGNASSSFILPTHLEEIAAEAFMSSPVTDVIIPESVVKIQSRAFADCENLKFVRFPNRNIEISDDAFDGCKVRFYAYYATNVVDYANEHNIPVILLGDSLRITNVEATTNQAVVGGNSTWTVQTTGGVGQVQFQYLLSNADQLVFKSDYSNKNFFSFTFTEAGTYTMKVICCDESGRTAEAEANPITVLPPPAKIISVQDDGQAVAEGDTISWAYNVTNPNSNATFDYVLKRNDEIIDQAINTTAPHYSYWRALPGSYVLEVTCRDGETVTTISSKPVVIHTEKEACPAAPQLIPTSNLVQPSTKQEDAPTLVAGNIWLAWNAIDEANHYGLTIQKLEENWKTAITIPVIENTKYQLTADLFAGITEATLYRVELYSVGVHNGAPSYWYFYILPKTVDESILVDGMTTAYWDQIGQQANSRVFAIESELPWNAYTDEDWLTLTTNTHGVTVHMQERDLQGNKLSGIVIISNGITEASIVITRSPDDSLTLDNHNWSSTEDKPTNFPYGGVFLQVSHEYPELMLTVSEKLNNGTYQQVYSTFMGNQFSLLPTVNGYTFKENTIYRFTFSGHMTKERYQSAEVASEVPQHHFYVYMTADGHAIAVKGKKDQAMFIFDSLEFVVNSTNVWTVTTDVDWLSITDKAESQRSTIKAKPNQTGSERTATVTYTCGSAEVTLKLTQPDTTPKMITPATLSKTESEPTVYTNSNLFVCQFLGNAMRSYRLENGSYVYDTNLSDIITSSGAFCYHEDNFELNNVSSNAMYRIDICNDATNEIQSYYIKFSKSSSSYITIDNVNWITWNASPSGESKRITLAASDTWTASSDSSWLKVSLSSGSKTSGKSLTITAEGNYSGLYRTGIITFKRGNDDTAYIKVTQETPSSYLAIYDDEKKTITENSMYTDVLTSEEQDYYIYVYSDDEWSITSNVSWITTKATNNRVRLSISSNSVGNGHRTGTITVTSGSEKRYLYIQQAYALAKPIVNWNVSTNSSSPSVIIREDHTISWTRVAGAAYYRVFVRNYTDPYYVGIHSFYVNETGAATYSFTVPEEWLHIDVSQKSFLRIEAYDAYGHKTDSATYYFFATDNPKALLDGSTKPIWENATDVPVSRDFSVSSLSAWTAVAKQNWISLSTTSGTNGDVLTVSLSDNKSSARSGQVIVTTDSNETILNITQCGILPEYPSLITPVLSEDMLNPSIVPADTDSLTLTWNQAPQAEYYWLSIYEMNTQNQWSVLSKSPYMYHGTGSYTFDNLSLVSGQLYKVSLTRSCDRHGFTGKEYFFVTDNSDAYILADGKEGPLFADLSGDDSFATYKITSSGTWYAQASDDWIMVANRKIDQEDLDENGYGSEYYDLFFGQPNTRLYISLLENNENAIRTGTVTLQCGNASMQINISQDPYYDTAKITSPELGETSSTIREIKPDAIALTWSETQGGTGVYHVTLNIYDEEERVYFEVYEKRNITSCSLTIPSNVILENAQYLLCLYTEVEGMDYLPKETYYFRTNSKNALEISGNANWDYACVNGYVDVSISAFGGSGGYKYAYELLCGGKQQQITEWSNWNQYRFALMNAGEYQIKFYVMDSTGTVNQVLSDCYTVKKETVILSITPTIIWSENQVDIAVTANGGSGSEYRYAYELLSEGKRLNATEWMSDSHFYFSILPNKEYQIRVYLIDGEGDRCEYLSEIHRPAVPTPTAAPTPTPTVETTAVPSVTATPAPTPSMVQLPSSLTQPDTPPKSSASTEIERIVEFGQKAGSAGSETYQFLQNILYKDHVGKIFLDLCIDKYTANTGRLEASMESIIQVLTSPEETIPDAKQDYGRRLAKEVFMAAMGKGYPDINAASDMNLLDVANDVTTVAKSLDELIYYNDVMFSGWNTYFTEFAASCGDIIRLDAVTGEITVLDQTAYDELKKAFRMRKKGDIKTLNDHIDGMLEEWAKNGKCVIENGQEPLFARTVNGDLCPEGKTYANISKMKKTATEVQENIERFGKIAQIISDIGDLVSLCSSASQSIQEIDRIRAAYTKNRQFLVAIKNYSAGDSLSVAIELLNIMEGDLDQQRTLAVLETALDCAIKKAIDEALDTAGSIGGGTVLAGILAGGKIAGMIPMVQNAKEMIDCQHLILGWSGVNRELQGALEQAIKESSPYTIYLADIYILWQTKGMEITKKYYQIIRDNPMPWQKDLLDDANRLINYINDDLIKWNEYRSRLWNELYR